MKIINKRIKETKRKNGKNGANYAMPILS